MRRILITIIAIAMIISMVGCTKKTDETPKADTNKTSETTKVDTNKTSETSGQQKQENKFDFDTFKNALEKEGFKVKKGDSMANLIGAIDGCFYNVNGVDIEVYKFDLNSKNPLTVVNIKMANESSQVKLDLQQGPMEIPAEINNNLLISGIGQHPDKDKILKVFKDLK